MIALGNDCVCQEGSYYDTGACVPISALNPPIGKCTAAKPFLLPDNATCVADCQ